MHTKIDKDRRTQLLWQRTHKEKNTEHTRMYIFFLDFPHHYSQQRSAVRSTAPKYNMPKITKQ